MTIRALVIPVFFAAYLINTKNFYNDNNNYSVGSARPLQRLAPDLYGLKLVVAGADDGTTAGTLLTAALANAGVTAPVTKVATSHDIVTTCPESFGEISPCFAGLAFDSADTVSGQINYTIRGDFGLVRLDAVNTADDDFQKRFLPLQWAIESTWINLTTGSMPDPPLAWEYTTETQAEYKDSIRRTFAKDVRSMLVVSWIVPFFPVLYTMAGRMAAERQLKLTEHLEVMGCTTLARVLSWHLSVSAVHLPGWIAMALIYYAGIFKQCGVPAVLFSFIIAGLVLTSWSMAVAAPFARHPTIAGIVCCGAALFLAIFGQLVGSNTAVQIILTVIFPPMYLIFTLRGFGSWEIPPLTLKVGHKSPDGDAPVIALMIMAILAIFIYPCIAVAIEHVLYDVRPTHGHGRFLGKRLDSSDLPAGVAVRLRHLRKVYTSRPYLIFGRKHETVAIEDLSMDIPRSHIFCLLGKNGSAKSSTLNAISGLVSTSGGSVRYADDLRLGVASQQDVLWDDLTPEEHVHLWTAIKGEGKPLPKQEQKQSDLDLLDHCGLSKKLTARSKTLSGGQKRKLALACALAGDSDLILLDEVSSGLDPISRRAIWRLISSNRGRATIVLTTHFLDEADALGDEIAILKAPGQLLAVDSPVALKTELGRGFSIAVPDMPGVDYMDMLKLLRQSDPAVTYKRGKGRTFFVTGSNDIAVVRELARVLDGVRRRGRTDLQYQIGSTTLEEVFLDLNADETLENSTAEADSRLVATKSAASIGTATDIEATANVLEMNRRRSGHQQLALTPGRNHWWLRGTFEMAVAVAHKRFLILRRSWIMPTLILIAVIAASCAPLSILDGRGTACASSISVETLRPMVYPLSEFRAIRAPPLISLGDSGISNSSLTQAIGSFEGVSDNTTFGDTLLEQHRNLTFGGMSLFKYPSQDNIIAFEGTEIQFKGLAVMNLFTNSIFQQIRASADTPFRIVTNFQFIPTPFTAGFGHAALWVVFFGIAMALWPSFAGIYPTAEKASGVRANEYSNGAKPSGLWLGHLMYEMPTILFVPTVLVIVFAAINKFEGLGYLWLILVLYGIAQTLWAFVISLMFKNPLASWAVAGFFNAAAFVLYFTMYMLLLGYDKSPDADQHLTWAHYGYAAINPVASLMRAAFASLNMFKLLCDGAGTTTTKSLGDISLFGAPILYLIVQALFGFGVCVWVDSGMPVPRVMRRMRNMFRRKRKQGERDATADPDVIAETARVEHAHDTLMVRGLTKKFRKLPLPSVDNVSFGVEQGDTFALIGPNGAGKTTLLACARGVERPTSGDVMVAGHSIVAARNKARGRLGVCPQHSALDANLSVYDHLYLYGRLKGVPRASLPGDIRILLDVAGLTGKADAPALSLSGGNQRKLSLMIALIGDRPVVLIDEFSSGVDPFSKREAWRALAALTADRAVVITTHSMEELDSVASRVGVIAARMLAVGTPASLKARFATYELHLPAERVDALLAYLHDHGLASAHRSYDTVTRVSVPGINSDDGGLDNLLAVLQGARARLGLEDKDIAVHEASTEAAFLAIVQEHNVREDEFHDAAGDGGAEKKKRWFSRRRERKMLKEGGA